MCKKIEKKIEKSCPYGQHLKIIYVWQRADVVY